MNTQPVQAGFHPTHMLVLFGNQQGTWGATTKIYIYICYIYINIYVYVIYSRFLPQKHRDLLQYLATWHFNVSLHIVHICNWLMVWNFFFFNFFHIYGNVIIPSDELIFVHRGRYTTNQIYVIYSSIFHGDIQWFGFAMMICWIFSSWVQYGPMNL